MKIGVFGTGVVGQTIAEKLEQLNHDVMIGTRSSEDTLARTGKDNFGRPAFSEWYKNHSSIKIGKFSEAAEFGEFLVNAANGSGTLKALELAGKQNLSNKILLDISNPLDFSKGMPPSLFVCNTDSLAEQIQRTYPEAKVVKGLNTMNVMVMVNPEIVPGDHVVFINGNDGAAKEQVKNLLITIGWKEKNIIDLGDITAARGTEQMLPIWLRLMGTIKSSFFNFNIVIGNEA